MTTETPANGRLTAETDADLFALLERISGSGPLDVQAARLMIEPFAAQSAATNATMKDLETIRQVHLAASSAPEMEVFERLDAEFHKHIFAATRSDLVNCVHDILKMIRGQSAWMDITRRSFTEARRRTYCDHHGRIVDALFERNGPAAAEAMRLHLLAVSRNLFGENISTSLLTPHMP